MGDEVPLWAQVRYLEWSVGEPEEAKLFQRVMDLEHKAASLQTQLEEARGYRENAALWMADQDTRIEGLEARLAAKDAEAEELRAQLQAAISFRIERERDLGNRIAEFELERNAALQRAENMTGNFRSEERAHLQTIDERDSAEDALSDAFRLVTGREPEWSNLFGYADAMEEITAALEGRDTALAVARKEAEELRAQLQAAVESGTAVVESQRKLIVGLMAERDAARQRAQRGEDELNLCRMILDDAGCHQMGIHNGIYGLIAQVRSKESALAAAQAGAKADHAANIAFSNQDERLIAENHRLLSELQDAKWRAQVTERDYNMWSERTIQVIQEAVKDTESALAAARKEAEEMRYGLRQMLNHLTGIDHEWAKEACSIARAALNGDTLT